MLVHDSSAEAMPSDRIDQVERIVEAIDNIIVGKTLQIRLCVTCLLARGHLLIEDMPGVGKTTLAHALAQAFGLTYQRVQFTSDLLPADVVGISIYRRDRASFEFHRGPIFSQLVLADEINRATPKAQSALLEAMEERQVTADGVTYPLPAPFFVVATRNPAHQIGTFPLPESQLDRFLMQISIGYPAPSEERLLLMHGERRKMIDELTPIVSLENLLALQGDVPRVHVSEAILDYVQALIAYTRESGAFTHGLSPRCGIALVRAAQAWAMMHGHAGIHPEDVRAVLPSIVAHRLDASDTGSSHDPGASILDAVPVP